ncbi:hypothetical protein PtA15_18A149 [Puccinia triticina]|uniref:Phosphoinositide phospholipase C n=1 Tax=Puccinia triticina TaxID=208348 RepID=A0ABY7D9V1_9BASI|nr:uncharacterized protein PtA15_18A149 [Puccinia triticina]WAQ93092.1 hypothetical protein PtA15_18A149 [Puccinia triticina]WAR63072.1 hypothetical protein PtB15_18B154 [Puccinia triticina]
MIDVQVPAQLKAGTLMLKVSAKKTIKTKVSLEYERGQIVWETKKGGSLNIESVREIRFGQDASYYRAQFKLSPDLEGRWLTIIYLSKKSTYKMLHLIACDLETFEIWKDTLHQILAFRRELLGGLNHMRKRQDYWLKQNWTQGDSTEDAKLDFQEIVNLCRKLNISVPQSDIRAHFDIADSQKRGYLDFPAFQHFVKLMKRRPDIQSLFQQFTFGRDLMSVEEFTQFMKQIQHSELSTSTIHAIYTKFLDDDDTEKENQDANPARQMTIEGFASFLQSADNSALHEKHTAVHQDMSLPLHDYFISTSHNTYLVGNQLKGESTVEGYIRALQHGCRSVELDCWDGDAGEPVIYHGRTLTRKLLLSEALKAISKHAFVASPYPLILSLEVHCQPSQQERLAELLKTCLGEALVDRHLENHAPGTLPSPKDLMYRILVKAKKPVVGTDAPRSTNLYSNFDSSATSTTSGSSTSSDSDLKRRISNASNVLGERFKRIASAMSIPSAPAERSLPAMSDQSPTLSGQAGPSSLVPGPAMGSVTPTKIPTAPLTNSLSSLIVYTVGVKARGFNKLTTYEPEHILSLSERTVNKFLKGGTLRMLDLIQHNRNHLTRAYPAATRVFSSNFLPHRFWAVGLQLVACNWQTHDLAMELNSAFFDQNGRSGYLLKPLSLRIKGKEKEAATKMHKYQLNITIISIQQLPKLAVEDDNAGIDPSVEVQVISPVPSSSCSSPPQSTKRRTRVVKGNGFNPVYHEEFKIQFQTPGEMLDLCFLRLLVIDAGYGGGNSGKDEEGLVGKVCVCLGALQPGYRHLPLHDDSGQQLLFASIFIKTSLSKLP